MKLISQIKEVKSKVSGSINFGESLSKHSWFNLGGPAKVIFRPKNLNELSLDELRKIEPKLSSSVLKVFDLNNSVNSKKSFGGTSFENIKRMIMKYKKI